jgi:membrane protease YdiL (CAAX protease family)
MTPRQVFINPYGRLRSGWRLLIFVFLYFALFFILASGLRVAYAIAIQVLPHSPLGTFGGYLSNFGFRIILLVPALIGGYICTRWLEGLPWRALGLGLHQGWFKNFIWGTLLGIVSLAIATAIATAGGGLKFSLFGHGTLLQVLVTLVASAVLFVVAALAEEAIFRGYPLQTLARARLALFGVLLTSFGFLFIHIGNPNISEGIPYLNLLVAGIWLAVAYLHTRDLWFPLGIHWGWNWALGSLFGLPVSGIESIAPHPALKGTDLGPVWLTGGSFGIEGGIACTIALVISTIIIWRMRFVGPTEEMKRLTSEENPAKIPVESK